MHTSNEFIVTQHMYKATVFFNSAMQPTMTAMRALLYCFNDLEVNSISDSSWDALLFFFLESDIFCFSLLPIVCLRYALCKFSFMHSPNILISHFTVDFQKATNMMSVLFKKKNTYHTSFSDTPCEVVRSNSCLNHGIRHILQTCPIR